MGTDCGKRRKGEDGVTKTPNLRHVGEKKGARRVRVGVRGGVRGIIAHI